MPTAVQELMSSPPVTCPADATLSEATALMDGRQIGSVVVTDRHGGGRHPHRAGPAPGVGHRRRPPRRAGPALDDRRPRRARPGRRGGRGLVRPHPPPLPPSPGGRPRRPGRRGVHPRPAGAWPRSDRPRRPAPTSPGASKGVVVAETSVGDVRGAGGLLPLPAVLGHRPRRPPIPRGRLAAARSTARCPTGPAVGRFAAEVAGLRTAPPGGGRAAPGPGRPGIAARRPPHRGVGPRGRAGLATRPTTSTTTSCGPRPSGSAPWSPPS